MCPANDTWELSLPSRATLREVLQKLLSLSGMHGLVTARPALADFRANKDLEGEEALELTDGYTSWVGGYGSSSSNPAAWLPRFQFTHPFHHPQIIRPRIRRKITFDGTTNRGAGGSVGTGDHPSMGLRVAVREGEVGGSVVK